MLPRMDGFCGFPGWALLIIFLINDALFVLQYYVKLSLNIICWPGSWGALCMPLWFNPREVCPLEMPQYR